MANPVFDELIQGQSPGFTVDQGQHVCTKGILELSVLVEIVEHNLSYCISLQFDN